MKITSKLPLFLGLLFGLSCAGITLAQAGTLSPELARKLVQSVDSDTPRLIAIFKDLHQNPELGFEAQRTAEIVAKEFRALVYYLSESSQTTAILLCRGCGSRE